MKKPEIITFSFIVLLAAIIGFLWLSPAGLQAAPNVQMTTLKQQTISVDGLKGKPALVVFWATSCPGCIKEMPHFVELYHQLHDKGLEIIGVAMAYDIKRQVERLVELRKIPYLITHDNDGKIAAAFGDVKLTPTTFLINPDGQIVRQKIGELDFKQLRADIEHMLKG